MERAKSTSDAIGLYGGRGRLTAVGALALAPCDDDGFLDFMVDPARKRIRQGTSHTEEGARREGPGGGGG